MSSHVLEAPRAPRRLRSPGALALFFAASLAAHGAVLLALASAERPRPPARAETVELVMTEVVRAPPPPPPPEVKEEPTPKPKPRRPPPIKVATAEKPPPPEPPEPLPPPPNEPPPAEPPAKPPPLVVGLSMSSTTTAGTVAAPVGNTTYGKTSDTAPDPAEARPYAAPKYMPIYQVDSEPSVLSEVKVPYPSEARRLGIEGTVTLSITVDAEGRVVQAKILAGPGHGLNEAALRAVRRFRFRPAYKSGAPVSTEMKYAYTFLLD